jgi:hypothetical protein
MKHIQTLPTIKVEEWVVRTMYQDGNVPPELMDCIHLCFDGMLGFKEDKEFDWKLKGKVSPTWRKAFDLKDTKGARVPQVARRKTKKGQVAFSNWSCAKTRHRRRTLTVMFGNFTKRGTAAPSIGVQFF